MLTFSSGSFREAGTVTFERFCADEGLVGAWQDLESRASLPTQSHAFASALWGAGIAPRGIEVVFARDRDGLAALLPLCNGAGRSGRRRLIGADEVCEPGDLLCRDQDAARLLARTIARDARPVELDRIPADSRLIPALRDAMRGKGLVTVRPATPTPRISLDASWTDPASRFNAGRRSDFRRAARRADEFGKVSFDIRCPSAAEFDALFDEAVGVELRSWKQEAGTAIASDRAKEHCFRLYFRSACESGLFRIAVMRIDGTAVAMQMGLEWSNRYWLFKIGYDATYGRCSPGALLMLHTLGWAAERELSAYELLGNLEPWIAQFWSREQQDCVCLRAYPFNPAGGAAFAGDAAAWLRRRLSPGNA
jgi:CelD/BcsL family acetyltransferase involved in cellulose biosynthesis